MSRYVKDLPTALPPDQAQRVASEYLQGAGFVQKNEKGEEVWRKGFGLFAVPQFVKTGPADGVVHIEAWVAGMAILPGVYVGEQGLDGVWGFGIKEMLRTRVIKLEELLAG